jgi:hypothetical protein
MPVIGFLNLVSPDVYVERLRAFRQGLKEIGLVEGENVAIEYRFGESQDSQLPNWRPNSFGVRWPFLWPKAGVRRWQPSGGRDDSDCFLHRGGPGQYLACRECKQSTRQCHRR